MQPSVRPEKREMSVLRETEYLRLGLCFKIRDSVLSFSGIYINEWPNTWNRMRPRPMGNCVRPGNPEPTSAAGLSWVLVRCGTQSQVPDHPCVPCRARSLLVTNLWLLQHYDHWVFNIDTPKGFSLDAFCFEYEIGFWCFSFDKAQARTTSII